ncbi:MAG: hypothetical protein KGH57_00875 [Candidatus Micrarchaeota archaeon]|nr:hypothetical protein [Candidatus Micrarchaeota archaeon]
MAKIEEKKIEEKRERVELKGIDLYRLLNPKFIKNLKKISWDADPVAIMLMGHKRSTKKKGEHFTLLVISHHSKENLSKKIISIEADDVEFLEKMKDAIKES